MYMRIQAHMRISVFILAAFIFSLGPTAAAQQLYGRKGDSLEVVNRARDRMNALCSDSLAGRGYVDDGHAKAARYLAREFRAAGVKPLKQGDGALEDYFQYFEFGVNLVSDAALSIDGKPLVVGKDFIPNGGSRPIDGAFDLFDAGHGLPGDWKRKAKGRFAIVRDGLPAKHKLSKEAAAKCRGLSAKIDLALEHGAAGIILVKDKLTFAYAAEPLMLPTLEVKLESLPGGKLKQAKIKIDAAETKIRSQNVVAAIRGKTTPDTAVVLCGHYDHMGKVGDAIFYGANDNASGASFLLALADYYAKHPPDKTLIFIAFGGEEAGLHGSVYYALHDPLFPLRKTKVVLNFDLLANGADGVMTVGGNTFTLLYKKLETINEESDLVDPLKSRDNAPNSDHYPFTLKNVPAFFLYTLGGPTHYHDIYDRPEAFKLDEFFDLRELMILYIKSL